MSLDRGVLGRIDRIVLSELDHGDGVRLVKVPLSKAVWSTWRRYCEAIGMTMGGAVAGLIVHELRTVVGDCIDGGSAAFSGAREEALATRESQIIHRERGLAATEARLSEWTERLGTWERELQARERRLPAASGQVVVARATGRKIGRNERCPCGSGLKYKHCHGSVEGRR